MHNNNKPFQIDRCLIYQSWLAVKANHGAAGIDNLDIKAIEKDYKDLLYKLWNRMSSGSYMASAIKKVEIPKNDGKGDIRILGIPTVLDRVAQTAVVKLLEPRLDNRFDQDSMATDQISLLMMHSHKPEQDALKSPILLI